MSDYREIDTTEHDDLLLSQAKRDPLIFDGKRYVPTGEVRRALPGEVWFSSPGYLYRAGRMGTTFRYPILAEAS